MYKYFIKSNRSIRHPCIVTLMGVCLFDDYQLMLVTNLIEGYNLQSIIFQKLLTVSMNLYVNPKPIKIHVLFMQLDTRSKLRISVQVAKAVSYLHSRRPAIIHQDIKPANILVNNIVFHVHCKGDFSFSIHRLQIVVVPIYVTLVSRSYKTS
jgi:serine/threonine protein kinase